MTDNSSPRLRRFRVAGRPRSRRKLGRSRGVSDVVATIILLAMTVVLFAAIFAFVTSFPSPPAQTANQFQASLFFSGSNAAGVNITHLAGPQVAGNGMIYVKSAGGPTQCFSGVPVTVASGISTPVWTLGETWHLPFSSFPGCSAGTVDTSKPDNLTIYVFSQATLLFSVVLPGQPFLAPPTILSTWTAPSPVTSGAAFRVYATVAGNLAGHKAFVNLAGITHYSGSTSTVAMWYNSSQSAWQFNVTGPNTSAVAPGTYYGVVNVTGSSGFAATATVTITVSPSFSASVTPSVSSFKLSTATPVTFLTTLTNFGSFSGSTVNVSLWVNGSSGTWTSSVPPWSNGKGGWYVTGASTTIGAYATLSWATPLTSPSVTSVITYTITISVTVKNAAFGGSGIFTFTATSSIVS